jgi:prepilin-type processing-associated H-X9-DG protein
MILVVEADRSVPWTQPDDLNWSKGASRSRLASPHAGGSHVVWADGSSKFIKATIEPRILEGLLTITGNEVLSGSG